MPSDAIDVPLPADTPSAAVTDQIAPVRRLVAAGDVALFAGKDRKNAVRIIKPGGRLDSHLGIVLFDDLIGKVAYGDPLHTHLGHLIYLLTPGMQEIIGYSAHDTSFIQPKDLGYIALKLNIRAGARVIEAGTGSGALTTWLALLVGDSGHVYSYDRNAKSIDSAGRHLIRAGADVPARVTLKTRDLSEGFDVNGVDALFLDVPNPWDYLAAAHHALISGGHFGALVPTMNQVITLTTELYGGPWFQVEIEELLLRPYKPLPPRVRPDDTMVAHTGYLLFARSVNRVYKTEPTPSEAVSLTPTPLSPADSELLSPPSPVTS